MSTVHQRNKSTPPVDTTSPATATPADNAAAASPTQASPTSSSPKDDKDKVVLLADEDKKKKWASWRVRFIWTWIMLFGFSFIFAMGHIPLMFFVLFIQVCMYREIVKLTILPLKEKKLHGGWQGLVWYWFAVALFFCYGQLAQRYFGIQVPYHTFISFSLECAGLVIFVLMLRKGSYKYQFVMFAWCQLTLLLVVVQSTFLIVNMFQGLIWFILPALLIIANDIWAYFWGFFFGKTPLIKLSPKKTWEGFVGGAIMTLLYGFLLSRILSQFDLMICGKKDFSMAYPHCSPSTPFLVAAHYDFPAPLVALLQAIEALPGINIITTMLSYVGVTCTAISVTPMQIHGVVIGLFASFLAPFGGFFASGFKRAFKIKDFGDTIPGHGGFTDRMDCQIMMSLFAYVYYWTFVVPRQEGEYVLEQFTRLSGEDKLRIWQRISEQVAPLLKQ